MCNAGGTGTPINTIVWWVMEGGRTGGGYYIIFTLTTL